MKLILDILDANGIYFKIEGIEEIEIDIGLPVKVQRPKLIPIHAKDAIEKGGTYYYWNGIKLKEISADCIRLREGWKGVKLREKR